MSRAPLVSAVRVSVDSCGQSSAGLEQHQGNLMGRCQKSAVGHGWCLLVSVEDEWRREISWGRGQVP